MSERDNGGPAFPFVPNEQPHNSDGTWCQDWDMGDSGMTLRDYAAIKAMQSFLVTHPECAKVNDGFIAHCDFKYIAESSFMMADAMLQARGK